jgi:serine/threonine protein kinase
MISDNDANIDKIEYKINKLDKKIKYINTETQIKLENILYRRQADGYQYAICDFGNSMTETNPHPSVIQTTQYRCMESILEMYPYTTVSDMTSIGCVLYEMATGNYLLEVSSQDEDYNIKTHAKLLVDLVGKEGFEGMDVPPILQPYLTDIPSCSISQIFGKQWVDLIVKMIHPIKSQRISSQDVLGHIWVNE